MIYASFWRRFCAHGIDIAILLPVMALLSVPGVVSQLLAICLVPAQGLLYFLYTFYLHAKSGQTLGKRWLKIRVLTPSGSAIGFVLSARRNIIIFFQSLPWICGTMIAISRIPIDQYYALHGHAYNLLEESLRPEWYASAYLIMGAIVIPEVVAVLTSKRKQSLHDFVGGTVVIHVAQPNISADAER